MGNSGRDRRSAKNQPCPGEGRARHDTVRASTDPRPQPIPEAALARRLLDQRRRREAEFGSGLFGEPAWDILLTLFVARADGQHISVSALCSQIPVPATTAHRWMLLLIQRGLLVRIGDRFDRRRSYVYLSAEGARRMASLLSEMMSARA